MGRRKKKTEKTLGDWKRFLINKNMGKVKGVKMKNTKKLPKLLK